MSFLKDYTISIMIVSLVAILLENLLPKDSNQKYCNVLIGLFVMLVILKPLARLPHVGESFTIPSLKIGDED
ncbi:MAG: stage III sporulation protein AF, partial [Clostridia bacterium]|nr:stage III sporulation protein AF [Clostridia bacterium]